MVRKTMLKKAGNIAIILLLLIATGGMPVTMHYCGKVAKSFSLYTSPKSCCDGPCEKCHNVFKFNKLNDVFESGSAVSLQSVTENITLHSTFYIDLFNSSADLSKTDFIHQRAGFHLKAGLSPASLGNFRC